MGVKSDGQKICISAEYLYLPIKVEQETKLLEIYLDQGSGEEQKITEFLVPVAMNTDTDISYDYFARFPVKQFTDKTLILKGDFPAAFWDAITVAKPLEPAPSERPTLHFTATAGWLNDPNGLVCQDGVYHLYFQYNPFDTVWNNMSWGHAVSTDLLHWEQKDTVMFPDEHGTIFSGSAITNERSCLNLPPEALIYFYTAAGDGSPMSKEKPFTQRLAYSIDNGASLVKTDLGVLQTNCLDSRDPKVFWHEESSAYIMVLWLEKNDFGIYRSTNLEAWSMTQTLTLDGAWECPDLIKLPDDEWLFWSADGYYFWGEFDGYTFTTDGVRHHAYMNTVPYAAQTYAPIRGIAHTDAGQSNAAQFNEVRYRIISVPWLRISNQGRLNTGAMGIPRELSVRIHNGQKKLAQHLVQELHQQKQKLDCNRYIEDSRFTYSVNESSTVMLQTKREQGTTDVMQWQILGTPVSYQPDNGLFQVGAETMQLNKGICDFEFVIDDNIFEVMADYGTITGAFALTRTTSDLVVEATTIAEIQLFLIK